jgi:hypothetical protein
MSYPRQLGRESFLIDTEARDTVRSTPGPARIAPSESGVGIPFSWRWYTPTTRKFSRRRDEAVVSERSRESMGVVVVTEARRRDVRGTPTFVSTASSSSTLSSRSWLQNW